ncbi:hypothetical protein RR48_03631 [Papilio machaon]|uniref:Uncharacterized protein n=1 Tax=Papilio machaon TaxID=76193 RepID=A0A0N0PAZ9_PAPMA|nr:hypothetical protein RR48_03631 [Papilio machaon]
MTSEEPIDVVTKSEKKTGTSFPSESSGDSKTAKPSDEHKKRSQELMRLVYELPEDIRKPEINVSMLKENPPITILEITEQNGCETELGSSTQIDSECCKGSSTDNAYDAYPNEIIMQCDEYKEVIDRSSPDDCTDEDLLELKKILENKPKVLERYLRECASSDEVNRIHNITSCGPLSPRPHHEARSTSVTSDLFQLWLSSSPVKDTSEQNKFESKRMFEDNPNLEKCSLFLH